MLAHPGFVRAAPTLPGTSRVGLPSAPPPCCDRDSDEGLPPPFETAAPHGAHVRDVTFGEDHSQVRTGHGPTNLACLRNLAINALRLAGHSNINAAQRLYSWTPGAAIEAITAA